MSTTFCFLDGMQSYGINLFAPSSTHTRHLTENGNVMVGYLLSCCSYVLECRLFRNHVNISLRVVG